MTTWIFGASGSIGRKICERALERGDEVVAFTSTVDSANELTQQLDGFSGLTTHGLNLLNSESLEKIANFAKKKGPEHVIYLSRGRVALDSHSDFGHYDEYFYEDFFLSLMFPIKLSLKLGKICPAVLSTITLASSQYGLNAQNPTIYENPSENISSAYCSIRGGVNQAVKSLAVQLGPSNIRVNAVALGGFDEATPEKLRNTISSNLPGGSMLNSREIEGVFLFLSSGESGGLTGSTIVADKGWTSK
jgi:NAD(P)-dependent dehydrogenase (short-subunit alcohol dehydrogenase family)